MAKFLLTAHVNVMEELLAKAWTLFYRWGGEK